MADWGFKITQDGYDVTTTDLRGYVLDSKYDVSKTFIVGTAGLSFSSEADTEIHHNITTVNHNLGYRPMVFLFWGLNGQYGSYQWWASQGSPHYCYEYIQPSTTTTQFSIDYYYSVGTGDGLTGISSYNFSFKYYIFIDQGAP